MVTRNIVPRNDNEGGIGTSLKKWATGFINILGVDVVTVTSINGLIITSTAGTLTIPNHADAKLITSGNYSITLTATEATGVTLPASGTLYGTLAGSITSAQLLGSLSDETGSGLAVFNNAPTIVSPVILNLNPAADFTLTQNGVAALTSVNAGAVVNTFYLKAGNVGIGTVTPNYKGHIWGGALGVQDPTTLGSESLNETAFATHAKWDVTGDFVDTGGNAVYTHATGVGTLTQTSANLAITVRANRWYKFVYPVSSVTAGCTAVLTTGVAATQQTLTITAGTQTLYFLSASSPGNFVISVTSTAGGFTLDDLSLMEVQGGDIHVGGKIYLGDGSLSAPSFTFGAYNTFGFLRVGGGLYLVKDGAYTHAFTSATHTIFSNDATIELGLASDTILIRDAANTLALRNALNNQTFNIYSAQTSASNYKGRLSIAATASTITLAAQSAGATADANIDIILTPKGTGAVNLGSTVAAGALGGTLLNSVAEGDPAIWIRVKVGASYYAVPGWLIP